MKRKNVTKEMMKTYMAESLIQLMGKKDYSDITINEIVIKAGVHRSTYYRNFSSKEDIVKFYFSSLMQAYLNEYDKSSDHSFENYMHIIFNHFYKYRKELLSINKNGLSYCILEILNKTFEESHAEMGLTIAEQYKMYFHTGGIYNFYILWFSRDMKDTPDELTKIALSCLPSDVGPRLR
jgi:AcrR family transcriptional regulator